MLIILMQNGGDEHLLETVKEKFEIIKFHTVNIVSKTPGIHFQSLLLRRKEYFKDIYLAAVDSVALTSLTTVTFI